MAHIPYHSKLKRLPDFVVEYCWNPDDDLKSCKLLQGIRSDFLYDGDDPEVEGIHMIWPEFLDEDGNVVTQTETEVNRQGFANMWIMLEDRIPFHKERMGIGTKGFMVYGSKKLAEVKVFQTNYE